ncbi:UDP-N-acetylmuramyl peptide synthase [Pseudoscardovia radai]|jgi:UDP-N-acetylmuramyl tripeptide synthase|uniref:UDP-N-acetylmuramyl peptide synthase n=1 Tax=Pseudoscardovia radai TaxID=987066 RepID=UPI0039952DF3
MGSLSESTTERTTIGDLNKRFGIDIGTGQAAPVTITSLADDLQSVTPGALFIVGRGVHVSDELITAAADRGAYAVLLPTSMRSRFGSSDPDIPLLFGDLSSEDLSSLAAQMAGYPANQLAIFAVCGNGSAGAAEALADLLHVLGNPVGLISNGNSYSLERDLVFSYPIGGLQVESMLFGAMEDGATSVVIDASDDTLLPGSLAGVSIDVCGLTNLMGGESGRTTHALMVSSLERYSPQISENTHATGRTSDSDEIAHENLPGTGERDLSMGIAMVMQAGIRKNGIRNALRVVRDFT